VREWEQNSITVLYRSRMDGCSGGSRYLRIRALPSHIGSERYPVRTTVMYSRCCYLEVQEVEIKIALLPNFSIVG
jgi:hypothetical protein